jgi:hypothetical protein
MGAALVLAGAYGMWYGWDIILNERGWSAYIAGAVMLSGGVVTIALGRVIAYLSRLAPLPEQDPAPLASASAPEPAPTLREAPPSEAPAPERGGEPTEVDRYANGDEIYTMFSDGSVEVSGPRGFRRFPSLAALRADAEARKR